MNRKILVILAVVPLFGAALVFLFHNPGKSKKLEAEGQSSINVKAGHLRVAAIQMHSPMGQLKENREKLIYYTREAAKQGAKIIVTPECALQGYCYPPNWTVWVPGDAAKDDERSLNGIAESVPGPATERFGQLAKELKIYFCLGMIEKDGDNFYNSQVLFDPKGDIVAHHRKKNLWTPGDSSWATKGEKQDQVVDSPYGKLGLMICFDVHMMPQRLDKKGADIILYSVGWFGPNEKNWFTQRFPRKAVTPYQHHVISANWSGNREADAWPGLGYSCIIRKDGSVLNITESYLKDSIVLADLPISKQQ